MPKPLEITGGAGPGMVQGVHALNLVFDVEGTRVFLAPKEAGKRSQLWRMTSAGLLVHEGSSPPQMPRGRGDAHQDLMANNLVLDIAGPAVQPNTYVPLMLRKPDERRLVFFGWSLKLLLLLVIGSDGTQTSQLDPNLTVAT